jgi:hypothetical protein
VEKAKPEPKNRTRRPSQQTIHHTQAMNLKHLFARWIASRIESRTRCQRRALRDYHRLETARIQTGEKRSRGLRLYIAWAHPKRTPATRVHADDWHDTSLPQAA